MAALTQKERAAVAAALECIRAAVPQFMGGVSPTLEDGRVLCGDLTFEAHPAQAGYRCRHPGVLPDTPPVIVAHALSFDRTLKYAMRHLLNPIADNAAAMAMQIAQDHVFQGT